MFSARSFHTRLTDRISPSVPMICTLTGMFLPQAFTASLTARSIPPQQGTSMRVTVTVRIEFCERIAVNFSV